MNRKKFTAMSMAALMAAGSLTAGTALPVMAEDEVVNLKFHTILSEQADQEEVFNLLNEYTKEKIGITCEWVHHGGSYGDKIQTIIASGEEYDACFTSNWLNSYNTNVAKGAFMDITDILPTAAPTLMESVPDYFWEAAKVNGGLYAVPNQQIVARQICAAVNKEWADAAMEEKGIDITKIHNYGDPEAEEFGKFINEKYGAKFGCVVSSESPAYCGYEVVNDYLSAGVIKMDDETATVVNYYETPEWLEMLNQIAHLNDVGVMDGECGYMPEYGEGQTRAQRTTMQFGGTYKPGVEAEEKALRGYDPIYVKGDIDPYISTSSVIATMYGISATSKHPEETLKYLELINTDPYAMNLVSYGIEGKHYDKISDNVIKLKEGSGYYGGGSWAIGNVFNSYVMEGQPEDVWEQTIALNDSAKTSPILGFSFDPEPVKLELTNVSKVSKEYENLIGGALPVEETNAEFVEKLKAAGVDTVIAEMQRQIDEFLAAKK